MIEKYLIRWTVTISLLLSISAIHSQSMTGVVSSFPSFYLEIKLNETAISDLVDKDDVVELDTTEYGWVDWNIDSKEVRLRTHLYDLNEVIRTYQFIPTREYQLNNGLVINKSNLQEAALILGIKNHSTQDLRLWTDDVIYHFSQQEEKKILSSVEVRNLDRAKFSKRFLLDSLRFEFYFANLSRRLEWISLNPENNLVPSLIDINLMDSDRDIRESITRELEDDLFQHQIRLNHYFLSLRVNMIFEGRSNGKVLYYSMIFGDRYVYESINGNTDSKWRSTNDIREVGFWCSASGSPPEMMNRVLELINDEKYLPFIEWMDSNSPEVRIYGAIGLFFFRFKNSVSIDDEIINKASSILSANKKIYGCKGCFYGTYLQKEIVHFQNLYLIYEGFVQNGFIR